MSAAPHTEFPRNATLFERVPLPIPYYLLWPGVFVLLCGCTLLFAEAVPAHHRVFYRAMCIFVAAGIATIPLAAGVGYRILVRWAPHLDDFMDWGDKSVSGWFKSQLQLAQGSWSMAVSGVIVGTLALLAYHEGGYFGTYHAPAAALYASMLVFTAAGFAGLGLHFVMLISGIFWNLGSLPGAVVRVHRHGFGVLSTGTTLFKIWFMAALAWSTYVASAVFGAHHQGIRQILESAPMQLLAYPTLPLIVGSFIVCQIPLHRKMVLFKRAELARLDRVLDSVRPVALGDMTEEQRKNVEFLVWQKESYLALPNWPFNLRALIGAGVSSLTALFPFITQVIKQLSG